MIELRIKTDGAVVADLFKKKAVTIQEVSLTLLRLKQSEQESIDIEFDDDLYIKDD